MFFGCNITPKGYSLPGLIQNKIFFFENDLATLENLTGKYQNCENSKVFCNVEREV